MKLRGVVKGQTIVLDAPAGLPEGQQVEMDVHPVVGVVETSAHSENPPQTFREARQDELETRIAAEPQFENIRRVDQLREKIAKELGGELNLSVPYVREDRGR